MNEKETFDLIKKRILKIQQIKDKPIRIAVNGIEGTGKTVFVRKMVRHMNSENLNAIQVSIDGFHFKKAVRYKQGRNSAKGYYEDAYNEIAFIEKVLKSSQSKTPNYTKEIHDLKTDKHVDLKTIEIDKNTLLITDGAYLFKPNYRQYWDLKIYLKTSFEIAMSRGIARDKDILGGFALTKAKYKERYHKASKIYLMENEPEKFADLIIDNSDFNNLIVIKV